MPGFNNCMYNVQLVMCGVHLIINSAMHYAVKMMPSHFTTTACLIKKVKTLYDIIIKTQIVLLHLSGSPLFT